ncbi:right-handed parallel beta-helix repeat-containing protein [Marinicella sp. W31]|uniref:right-handed parallel beta-helix repeat-containing protein n=1 Tax=Marinicella sp. W31 TaxID=3023713 RepID=UPI0037562EF6
MKLIPIRIEQLTSVLFLALVASTAVQSAEFIVTTNGDQGYGIPIKIATGVFEINTFRSAIELANLQPDSMIKFDAAVFSKPQTITMENGEFFISSDLIINGPGANLLTINAGQLSRVLNINDGINSKTSRVDISGLTFTNGRSIGAGGCIMSQEALFLRASVISNCYAGANGGGVYTSNFDNFRTAVLIENSSFYNNTSDKDGGGLFHQNGSGNLVINSIFSGNIASRYGGGLYVHEVRSMNVFNSTFSGNQAKSGAGIFSSGAVQIDNSTIVNNLGTGVRLDQGDIRNSIIVNNTNDD